MEDTNIYTVEEIRKREAQQDALMEKMVSAFISIAESQKVLADAARQQMELTSMVKPMLDTTLKIMPKVERAYDEMLGETSTGA